LALNLKILALIVALIIVSASAVWVVNDKNQNDIPDYNPDDQQDNDSNFTAKAPIESVYELVNSNNNFTFEMYKQLINGDDNVFFSPYSITTALGMAFEGARGQTALEMARVLNFTLDNQTRWDIMSEFQDYFNNDNSSYNLSAANAFWLAQNGVLNEDYRMTLITYYLAHGEMLDFAGDPEGSAETINAWVEANTGGKIIDILSPGDITAFTYLVLTNAIYFKSDWKYQFDPAATDNMTFSKSDGETVQAEMMHLHDENITFNYSANQDVQMLQLPYKGNEVSMYILLPRTNNIASLESMLDMTLISELKGNLTSEEVDIYLPKFTFEQKYELKDCLSDLGMPTAFSGAADFSGITDAVSLSISSVIHQSFICVNESGTEAAAATVVIMTMGFNPESFVATHPFIFFIQHEETGQILFMGKVENPTV
jgi:serpin B